MIRTPSVRDARGRIVRVASASDLRVSRPGHDGVPRETFLRLLRAESGDSRARDLAPAVFGVALGAMLFFVHQVLRPPLPVLIAGVVAITFAFAMILSLRRKGCNPGSIADALLAEGLCPSCAYDLRACPTDQDGCTPCPECGAAWRLASGAPA